MALLKRKRSGLSDPMSVVTRFVNACNRHDADSVGACLHPEFDSIQPMFPSRNFRGADQVRRNWQAIFEAEPGFRLTVLRQAAADDTVWLELHGAGRDAEVAGIFVMGVQGDRIRWARIYSGLIEPLPEGFVDPVPSSPATLREVPPLQESSDGPAAAPVGAGVVEEDLIAPVVDIDGSGRARRRRSARRRSQPSHAVEANEPPQAEVEAEDDDGAAVAQDGSPDLALAVAEDTAVADDAAVIDWGPRADPGTVAGVEPVEPETVEPEVLLAPPPDPEVMAAAELLEEHEPEVVAEPVPEPTLSAGQEPAPHPSAPEPATIAGAVGEPGPGPLTPPPVPVMAAAPMTDADAAAETVAVAAPSPADTPPAPEGAAGATEATAVIGIPAASGAGPDDIVWGELTSEELAGPEPEPTPPPTMLLPGDQGRPGKRRGRKRR